MKLTLLASSIAAALVLVAGCASEPQLSADAPAFTEAEKAAMTPEEKMAIYNQQVRDDDRVICEKVRKTGTRLKSRNCRTAKQKREENEAAREAIRRSHGVTFKPTN